MQPTRIVIAHSGRNNRNHRRGTMVACNFWPDANENHTCKVAIENSQWILFLKY